MNCELAHERIVSATYGELSDEHTHELERHMDGCPDCQKEREQLRALKVLVDAYPVVEPSANLLAHSRMRLEDALDAIPPKRWYQRLAERLVNNFATLETAPIAATALLAVGIAGGLMGGYEYAMNRVARATAVAAASTSVQAPNGPVEVASISSIVRKPNSEMVEVSYNQVVPQRIQGSLDDPAIRQLLMLASENATSAGVRDDSVDLMASECRAGHSCKPAGIRDALMVALRYDKSATVREKALKGLEPYVAEDVRVRDAVLESLMYDSDARIRTAAINVLGPVDADTSVRQVLHTVAHTDRNSQIRLVSQQVLSRVPQIQ